MDSCQIVESTTNPESKYIPQLTKEMAAKDELFFPAIDVNDCVTKPSLDHIHGRCDSLNDDSMCATDVMIGVKRVLAYMEGLQVTDIESVVLVMDSMVSSTRNVSSETENPLEFLTSVIVLSQTCRYDILTFVVFLSQTWKRQ